MSTILKKVKKDLDNSHIHVNFLLSTATGGRNKTTKQMTKTNKNASEIADLGGAIASSEWVTGSGNYIKKRPIPFLCKEIDVSDISSLKGRSHTAARRLLKLRPRIRKMIVVSDWRKLNKLLKK